MNSPKHINNSCETPQCQMREALTFLQQLAVFRGTSLDILKLYAYLSSKEQYKPGEAIVLQGQRSVNMYLITSGTVSICEEHKGKNYRLQELSAEGLNYFGELALLARFDWFFSAWAETDVTVLSISREAFQKVMERFPHVYTETVEKIITLRIERSIDQTRRLIEKTTPEAWEEKPGRRPHK